MSSPSHATPPVLARAGAAVPSTRRTLRRLFLTLFLRGRGARGLRKESAPKSVGSKLGLTLLLYALAGLLALICLRQPVFSLSLYLHGMTLVFLGMFVAASAGEVLFNKEEGDILMHRPVTARELLWAKIGVLVEVSLWLAGAFNLVGFIIGFVNGGWLFPIVHAFSTALEALFCTGCVVMVYQLCLRWFGRERLDGLMTTAQVFVSIAAVLAGQIVPRVLVRFGPLASLGPDTWWVALLPPAWFAGLDDALVARGSMSSWILAAVGLGVTGLVLWLAFGKLARDYEMGLQTLNEVTAKRPRSRGRRRWTDRLVHLPPLRWWLRDSVARASFLLTVAYLFRDRDLKLRIYPGVAPMMIMPVIFLLQDRLHGGAASVSGSSVAFAGGFLGLMPLMGLNLLQYSQQWQAADIFRAAPISGPAQICHGARRAILCVLTFPLVVLFMLFAWVVHTRASQVSLFLPGIIALPVYALIPHLGGHAVPLSLPTEEAKSASRGLSLIGVMIASSILSGVATLAWSNHWFWWFLPGEAILALIVCVGMIYSINKSRWPSLE